MGWIAGQLSLRMSKQILTKWLDLNRTDRTRHRICYADTYQIMFDTLEKKIVQGKTKHLLLLLGVPIGMSTFTLRASISWLMNWTQPTRALSGLRH